MVESSKIWDNREIIGICEGKRKERGKEWKGGGGRKNEKDEKIVNDMVGKTTEAAREISDDDHLKSPSHVEIVNG